MAKHSLSISKPRPFAVLTSVITDWAHTDGLTWIYLAKALIACFLALGVAMKLDLAQPRTAMITVFIVMQPRSGMVLAKSFYRICATLIGLAVTLALVSLFSQQPELFIISTGLWIAICTAGAARNRNFKSYGFVLAGYTAALIGFPAAQHPGSAFISASTRVAEVIVGILSSGLVSAIVFPRHNDDQLSGALRDRFTAFVQYVSTALAGRIDLGEIEAANARLVADIVNFESIRSVAVFENSGARMRRRRFSRLNNEFMTASTRFYTLYQSTNRLRESGTHAATSAIERLQPYLSELVALLVNGEVLIKRPMDAMRVVAKLEAYQAQLQKRMAETHTSLGRPPADELLEFDTGIKLLYRFVNELHAYIATYASLEFDSHDRERWTERYEPKTNVIAAAVSGVRIFLLTVVLGAFWIETASPNGLTLLVGVSTVAALISSSPNPRRTAFQMAVGALLSSVTGMITVFGVYPYIDGFPLLCAALTPFLLIGVFLTIRPKLAGCGVGYLIFYSFLAGPDNVIHYDPGSFINDSIALVVSMLVTTIAFAVLLPPSTPWLRNRLLGDLRRQVTVASRGGLKEVRSRFESGTRDLAYQINALASSDAEVKRHTLRWLLLVLEIGNAVIDLRKELSALSTDARFVKLMPWRISLHAMLDELIALFDVPNADHFDRALSDTVAATAAVQKMAATFIWLSPEWHCLQSILSQLYFIRTALLDSKSPLEPFINGRVGTSGGVPHAA